MPMEHGEILVCTCCGSSLRNTPEENVSYGVEPYPHDEGFGACRECFGEAASPELQLQPSDTPDAAEKKARRRMGWAAQCFYDSRIETVLKSLNEVNRAKFVAMSYVQKCNIIAGLVEKGVLI